MPQSSVWPWCPHFAGAGSEMESTHYLDWTVTCRITSVLSKACGPGVVLGLLQRRLGLRVPPSRCPSHVPPCGNVRISFRAVLIFPTSALCCQNNCLKEEALRVIKCHLVLSIWSCRRLGCTVAWLAGSRWFIRKKKKRKKKLLPNELPLSTLFVLAHPFITFF